MKMAHLHNRLLSSPDSALPLLAGCINTYKHLPVLASFLFVWRKRNVAAILFWGRRRVGAPCCGAVLLTACLFQELCQVIQQPDIKVLKNYVKV